MNRKLHLPLYVKVLIPVMLLAGIYIFYRVQKRTFLQSGLPVMVEEKTNSLYQISYDSIFVDEAAGDLYIKNLHIKGDTARQIQLIRAGDTNASKIIVDVFIPRLEIVDFKTVRALLAKQLKCREIIINNPQVKVYLYPGLSTGKDEVTQRKELYKQILGSLKLIQADRVLINNSQVIARDYFTGETKFSAVGTNINLHDVLIDSTYREDTSRTLFCKEIKVKSNRIHLGDKNNTAQVSGMEFNTTSKIVLISRFEYDAFKNGGFFRTNLRDIAVDGIEWKGPAEKSFVRIKNIVLSEGFIDTEKQDYPAKSKSVNEKDKILTGWIKAFTLDRLLVKSFVISSTTSPKKPPLIIRNNTLMIKGVKLDSTSRLNESLVNSVGEAELQNEGLTIISADKFYRFKVNGFKINTRTKNVWIKQLSVIPQFAEAEFARRARVKQDRYDLEVNNIQFSNIDMSVLLQGKLYASNVTVNSCVVKVYTDLSYPSTGKSKVGSYPSQLLFKLKVPVKIAKLVLNNTYVAYKEKNPITDSSGKVTFQNSKISITNISNLAPKAGEKTTVDFSSSLLGQIPLKGSLTFYLDKWQQGKFKAEAYTLKTGSATIFNQLTEPMSLVKIKSGVFNNIDCSLMLDNYTANGKLIMTYDDFKVALLKKKGEQIHKKNTLSILANAFIKNENSAGPKMRVASIVMQRDTTKSFFNFIWASMFSGAKSILGVPKKK